MLKALHKSVWPVFVGALATALVLMVYSVPATTPVASAAEQQRFLIEPGAPASIGFDNYATDIRLLNTSAATATLLIEYYATGQTDPVYSVVTSVTPLGGASLNASFQPLPAGFVGAAVVSSSEPVLAIVNASNGAAKQMGYTAFATGANTVYLPAIFKNGYGIWTTNFSVQNAGDAQASITMTYYNTVGTQVYSTTDTIPAGSARAYDQKDVTQLGSSFAGSVKITSDQPIAAAVAEESPVWPDSAAYGGYPLSAGATTVYAPSILKNAWGWNSDIRVQNIGSISTTVTIDFYDLLGAKTTTVTDAIPANTAHGFNQQFMSVLPSPWAGSVKITSTGAAQPIVAIVNEAHSSGAFLSYEAYPAAAGTNTIYCPSVLKNAWGWNTDIRVQNIGPGSTGVTIEFYNFSGVKTHYINDTIEAGSAKGFNQQFITQLGATWEGWAKVTSASQPIVAIVNEIHTSGGGIAYDGFNR